MSASRWSIPAGMSLVMSLVFCSEALCQEPVTPRPRDREAVEADTSGARDEAQEAQKDEPRRGSLAAEREVQAAARARAAQAGAAALVELEALPETPVDQGEPVADSASPRSVEIRTNVQVSVVEILPANLAASPQGAGETLFRNTGQTALAAVSGDTITATVYVQDGPTGPEVAEVSDHEPAREAVALWERSTPTQREMFHRDVRLVRFAGLHLHMLAKRTDSGWEAIPVQDDAGYRWERGAPLPLSEAVNRVRPVVARMLTE